MLRVKMPWSQAQRVQTLWLRVQARAGVRLQARALRVSLPQQRATVRGRASCLKICFLGRIEGEGRSRSRSGQFPA